MQPTPTQTRALERLQKVLQDHPLPPLFCLFSLQAIHRNRLEFRKDKADSGILTFVYVRPLPTLDELGEAGANEIIIEKLKKESHLETGYITILKKLAPKGKDAPICWLPEKQRAVWYGRQIRLLCPAHQVAEKLKLKAFAQWKQQCKQFGDKWKMACRDSQLYHRASFDTDRFAKRRTSPKPISDRFLSLFRLRNNQTLDEVPGNIELAMACAAYHRLESSP